MCLNNFRTLGNHCQCKQLYKGDTLQSSRSDENFNIHFFMSIEFKVMKVAWCWSTKCTEKSRMNFFLNWFTIIYGMALRNVMVGPPIFLVKEWITSHISKRNVATFCAMEYRDMLDYLFLLLYWLEILSKICYSYKLPVWHSAAWCRVAVRLFKH